MSGHDASCISCTIHTDTGLPLITFEMSELIVSEDVAEPVMVCIRLSGVEFLQQAATVDISTQPGSADGTYTVLYIAWLY